MVKDAEVLRWEDPPGPNTGRGSMVRRWEDVARQLKERPGEWALIESAPRGTSMYLVSVINKQKPPFEPRIAGTARFRAVSARDKEKGGYLVYARYEIFNMREER